MSTKIRLEQLSGSLATLKPGSIAQGADATTELAAPSMQEVMEYYAQAIANIHGKPEFGSQVPGSFQIPIVPVTSRDPEAKVGRYDIEGVTTGDSVSWSLATNGFQAGSASAGQTANDQTDKILLDAALSEGIPGNTFIILKDDDAGPGGSVGYRVYQLGSSGASGGATDLIVEARPSLGNIYGDLGQADINSLSTKAGSALVDKEFWSVHAQQLRAKQGLLIAAGMDGSSADVEIMGPGLVNIQNDSHKFNANYVTTGDVELTAGDVLLSADTSALEIGTAASRVSLTHNTTMSELHSEKAISLKGEEGVQVRSMANGMLFAASGSHAFAGPGIGSGFTHGGLSEGGILMAVANDGDSLRTAFGANDLTVLGCLTSLKQGQTSLEPTSYVVSLAADVVADSPVSLGTAVGGAAASLLTRNKAQVDVFVNGQRLISGSTEDYVVDSAVSGAPSSLKFKFDLKDHDKVEVIDRG